MNWANYMAARQYYKELLYEPSSYLTILSAHIINSCFLVGQWQFAYLMHYGQYEFTIM